MPKLYGIAWNDDEGQTCDGQCCAPAVIQKQMKELGIEIIFTGDSKYSYRKSDGSIVFGRRPIGPRRAARYRRKL